MGRATGPSSFAYSRKYMTQKKKNSFSMRLRTGTNDRRQRRRSLIFSMRTSVLGGRLRVATVPVIADIPEENKKHFDLDNDLKEGAPVNIPARRTGIGPFRYVRHRFRDLYFSYPLQQPLPLIGSKLLADDALMQTSP